MHKETKVLIVCSGNSGKISPFITEQANSLRKKEIKIDFFLIVGKGIVGYLKNYIELVKKVKSSNPDLIHAHYGFSGMLAVLQRKVPVIITFHGSDINVGGKNIFISKVAEKMADFGIFVGAKLVNRLKPRNSFQVISCGIDLEKNIYIDRDEARLRLGFNLENKLILFSSNFNNSIKNYQLAKQAVELVKNAELIELKGYNRSEVTLLMNACDVLLVTSKTESGPLVVKEAIACGCPVVSTDVGDVREVIGNTKNCFITTNEPADIAEKLLSVLSNNERVNGKERINELELDINIVADKIISVYQQVLQQRAPKKLKRTN